MPTKAIMSSGISSSGVERTYRRPWRTCPFSLATRLAGNSSDLRIATSEISTAANDNALQAKHRAKPRAAASTPPSAAPKTRAMFIDTELRVTAFDRSRAGTISEMKLCRAGLSNTLTKPSARASR